MAEKSSVLSKVNINLSTVLITCAVAISAVAFHDGLGNLIHRWTTQDEYSHGFFIPLITLWLLWKRRDALQHSMGKPNWLGLIVVLGAAFMLLIGNLSAIYIIAQVGFIVSLAGIALRTLRKSNAPAPFNQRPQITRAHKYTDWLSVLKSNFNVGCLWPADIYGNRAGFAVTGR